MLPASETRGHRISGIERSREWHTGQYQESSRAGICPGLLPIPDATCGWQDESY